MERGGSSGGSKKEQNILLRQLQAAYSINSRANKGSPDSGGGSQPKSSGNSRIGIAGGKEPQAHNPPSCPVVREQDQYMPIANVIRIMRRNLPPHAKISDDAKETVQECVSEFISFITGEANDRCQREQRKTVTADDLLWAMGKLGFDNYVEPLNVYLERFREADDRAALRGDPAYLKRSVAEDFTGAAVSAAGSSYYLHHTMPRPPATMPLPIGFHAAENNMGMHAASGSSSSSPSQANLPSNTSFDPYAKYK